MFDGLQLIPSEFADFKEDIISASNMSRKKYNWTHFNLELKPIKSLYMPQDGNYGRANSCIQKNFLKQFNENLLSSLLESHLLRLKSEREIMHLRKLRLQFEVGLLKVSRNSSPNIRLLNGRIVASRLCRMLQCG